MFFCNLFLSNILVILITIRHHNCLIENEDSFEQEENDLKEAILLVQLLRSGLQRREPTVTQEPNPASIDNGTCPLDGGPTTPMSVTEEITTTAPLVSGYRRFLVTYEKAIARQGEGNDGANDTQTTTEVTNTTSASNATTTTTQQANTTDTANTTQAGETTQGGVTTQKDPKKSTTLSPTPDRKGVTKPSNKSSSPAIITTTEAEVKTQKHTTMKVFLAGSSKLGILPENNAFCYYYPSNPLCGGIG